VTGGQCLSCAQRASKDGGKKHGGAVTAGRESWCAGKARTDLLFAASGRIVDQEIDCNVAERRFQKHRHCGGVRVQCAMYWS
jgi:hypothetical protein